MDSICKLFQDISSHIWREVSNNNFRGNPLSEEGITRNSVISAIQDYMEKTGSNKVIAQKARKEYEHGGDLEIYLQFSDRAYIRYFLQAKALKGDNTYRDVNHKVQSNGQYQWDLLAKYTQKAKCHGYYLFYNGIKNYNYVGEDCAGRFNEQQLGCTIAKVDGVKNYCLTNKTGTVPFQRSDAEHPFGRPWRCLPCCLEHIDSGIIEDSIRLYSPAEIDMHERFERIFESTMGFIERKRPLISIVNSELENEGWAPSGRLLISSIPIKRGLDLYTVS